MSWWSGKILVLVLLGFAATDFLITMTLSAADASTHLLENSYAPHFLHGHQLAVTLVLLAALAAVFLRGFGEAIGIAVVLVGVYLALNAVVVGDALVHVAAGSAHVTSWWSTLAREHSSALAVIGVALVAFPKLALGLPGFDGFGTAYDVSTIAILWFAGASAMAGLLNLVPRYLPRYGMAPAWALAARPLVLVFAAVAFVVTWVFDADVDAQAGAYATGVLVLITSAAYAVTLSAHRRRDRMMWAYALITLIFAVTTVANMVERPDGLKIAGCFIAAVLIVSLVSRVSRAYEFRATGVTFDRAASEFPRAAVPAGVVNIIANEPDERDQAEYQSKWQEERDANRVPDDQPVVFLEVSVADASEFESDLEVRGEDRFGHQVLTVSSTAVANGIAAICLAVRDQFGLVPHVYFDWTEGSPLAHFLRFILWGSGEVAPVTREVLRRAEHDRSRRPRVHVG